jgi:chromosome segregation ATPase
MKDQVQQAAVRVVASELDRRAKPIEQAVRDMQARLRNIEAGELAMSSQSLAPIQHAIASVTAGQDRISSSVDALAARVSARELADERLDDAVRLLRADVEAIQRQLAQLVGVVERIGSTR